MAEGITIESLLIYIRKLEEKRADYEKLKEQVAQQSKEIKELKARLSKYEHPKNSRNSGIPPSKDKNRPKMNESLREKSDKKPDGRTEHEQTGLLYTEL